MIISLFVLLFCSSVFANSVDHWETVIYPNDIWSYKIGNSEIPDTWNTLYFDDTQWLKGSGGIGYGDGDDNTIIEQTASLYMRIRFDIIEVSKIESVILHMDYDDSFVAYLNGVEIARAGISEDNPAYNQFADTEHEAAMYNGGIPSSFIIDENLLIEHIIQGENLLSIQIHNSSSNSSDLSSIAFLSVGINDTSNLYRPTPDWFVEPFQFSSSDIPIVVIDTEGDTIVHEPKINASMGIINNGAGNRNSVSDPFNEYDGMIGIEYRGNASFRISDKKPLTIETRNDDGSNNNVKILGLPKENDFVLRAGYLDKTLMRDALAYHLYRKMGSWAPRTRHVELILNDNYQGVYILEEKIKPDKNRLDIEKMDSTDISGEALTGGYIWCTNRRWGDEEHNDLMLDTTEADGNQRFLRYPKPSDAMPKQHAYIRDFEQEFCDVMNGPNYNVPYIGYDKYINVPSFINEIIIQELTSNSDAYGYSGYFHKDRNEKISAGPEWDFDQALCNSSYNDGARTDEWIVTKPSSSVPPFWPRLFQETRFRQELKIQWNEYRKGVLQTDKIMAFIDSVANYLTEAQSHNFSKWPILGMPIWRSLPGAEERDTFQKEVDYLKEWLVNHIEWMDAQLYIDPTSVENMSDQSISEFKLYSNYPNPFNPETTIIYQLPKNSFVTLKVYDLLGREVANLVDSFMDAGKYNVEFDGAYLSSGIYFYRLVVQSKNEGNILFTDSSKMLLLK